MQTTVNTTVVFARYLEASSHACMGICRKARHRPWLDARFLEASMDIIEMRNKTGYSILLEIVAGTGGE